MKIYLPLNSRLIESKPVKNTPYLSIYLCETNRGYREFVIWTYNHKTKSPFAGEYFKSIVDAAKCFDNREL